MQSPIQVYLDDLCMRLASTHEGELANYIPELSKANPDWFGISIVTMDGLVFSTGDSGTKFTLQFGAEVHHPVHLETICLCLCTG